MAGRVVYAVLALLTLSMLLHVGGFIGYRGGWPQLAGLCFAVAGKLLLLGFAALAVAGLLALFNAIRIDCGAYFREDAAALRRLLATLQHSQRHSQRHVARLRHVRWFAEVRRQRLLRADDRRQLLALYRTLLQELEAARPGMPAAQFAVMRKTLQRLRRRGDFRAMLGLRDSLVKT